uniref:DUF8039 domain-containing protein n=1 Tax=Oryza brachyantha TaxID=4533 RepID=J3N828_ORYBR
MARVDRSSGAMIGDWAATMNFSRPTEEKMEIGGENGGVHCVCLCWSGIHPYIKYMISMHARYAMCILRVRVTPTWCSDAAEGQGYKPTDTTKVHGVDLVAGHAKVQVDMVKDDWLTWSFVDAENNSQGSHV